MPEVIDILKKTLKWTFFTMIGIFLIFFLLLILISIGNSQSQLHNITSTTLSLSIANIEIIIFILATLFILAVFNILTSIIYLSKRGKNWLAISAIIISAIIIIFILISIQNSPR